MYLVIHPWWKIYGQNATWKLVLLSILKMVGFWSVLIARLTSHQVLGKEFHCTQKAFKYQEKVIIFIKDTWKKWQIIKKKKIHMCVCVCVCVSVCLSVCVCINQNWIHSHFKNVSTTVFLNLTTFHVYNSYLQVELFIATIFYYIKEL